MKKIIFILGNNPQLSVAEISAVFGHEDILEQTDQYAVLQTENFDHEKSMRRLGGVIKTAEVIGKFEKGLLVKDLLAKEGKIIFGLSDYREAGNKGGRKEGRAELEKIGLSIKKTLKESGRPVRFVVSKEPVLSSVVISKNKCQEYIIIGKNTLCKTCAVQDFVDYGKRDFGRPSRDAYSGMIPPKLAKIMINLSKAGTNRVLYDPFCGSGTILQEALMLGFKEVVGSDISEKAISDTKKNIGWLKEKFNVENSKIKIFHSDVREISRHIQNVDVIVTEPYLGPALRGREHAREIERTAMELRKLYVAAFVGFAKILKKGAKVVFVLPQFKGLEKINSETVRKIESCGFLCIRPKNLTYSRPTQLVARKISLFEKK